MRREGFSSEYKEGNKKNLCFSVVIVQVFNCIVGGCCLFGMQIVRFEQSVLLSPLDWSLQGRHLDGS